MLQTRSLVRMGNGFAGPIIVFHGNCDQFASVSQVEVLLDEFHEQKRKFGQPPKMVLMPGCDHFFARQQQELAQLVCEWVCKTNFA